MSPSRSPLAPTRRELLTLGSGLAAAGLLPGGAVARTPDRRRVLLLVQMLGGNDDLNTVVRYGDPSYRRLRPTVAVPEEETLPVDTGLGFNAAIPNLHAMWQQGRMAVVEGVGYPSPVLSHFASLDIWHHAQRQHALGSPGWLGRLRETAWRANEAPELLAHFGTHAPQSLFSAQRPSLALENPESFLWVGDARGREAYATLGSDADAPRSRETASGGARERLIGVLRAARRTSPLVLDALAQHRPRTPFAEDRFSQSLGAVAAFVAAGMETRVFSVSLGNFDLHGGIRGSHERLLGIFDHGLATLFREVEASSPETELLVATYTDFGRRVAENGSIGTDHGAATSLFLFGDSVVPGLHGARPALDDLDALGNQRYSIDFRSVYATLLADWLDVDPAQVLDGNWPTLPLLGRA